MKRMNTRAGLRARQQGRIEVDAVLAAHLLLAVVVGILWELTR